MEIALSPPCELFSLPTELVMSVLSMLEAPDLISVRRCCVRFLRFSQSDALWKPLYDEKFPEASDDIVVSSVYKAPREISGWLGKYRKSCLLQSKATLLSSMRVLRTQLMDLNRTEQIYVRKESELELQRSSFVAKNVEIQRQNQESQLQAAEKIWLPSAVRSGLSSSSSHSVSTSHNQMMDTAIQQIDSLKSSLRNSRELVMNSRASTAQEIQRITDRLIRLERTLAESWPVLPARFWIVQD